MSRTYKAIQNKAMHKGAFIGYAVVRDSQWTTNGQVMVKHIATPEELKPLKGQYDRRVDGSAMLDFTMVIDTLENEQHVAMTSFSEWSNQAGLELIRVKGFNQAANKDIEVSVQGVYVDYVSALLEPTTWYITKDVLFATDTSDEIVAVISRVKPIKEDEDVQA